MKRFHFARVNEAGLTLEAMSATVRVGEVIKIGSHPQCAIRVKDDPNVLSMHATIELVEGRGGDLLAYKINNCGVSPMLLRVNNVPVDRSFHLDVGDVIRVGKTLLRLDAVDDTEDKRGALAPKQELPDDLSEVLNKVVTFLGLPKPDGSWTGMALAFAKWLAFAQAFVADPDGQRQATWTEVMLRVVGTRGMLKGSAEAVEACEVADVVLREKVKRFPPRMVSYGGEEDDSAMSAIEHAEDAQDELRRWREATGHIVPEDAGQTISRLNTETARWRQATGCNTPGEVASIVEEANTSVDVGLKSLADLRERVAGWREATGCDSLEAFDASADEYNATMQKTHAELTDLEEQIDAWRQATGCGDPGTAKSVIVELHNSFAKEHEKRRANIQSATDDRVAREQELAALRVQIYDWQNVMNRDTPAEAAELIGDIKHKWELEILKCVDVTNERNIARRAAELAGEKLTRWRMVTGYEDPGAYKNHLERAANLADVHDRMIAERDQTIIEYAKEIDRLREATRVALRDCADAEQSADRAVEAMRVERDEMDRVSVDAAKRADSFVNDLNKAVSVLLDIRSAFGGATVDRICEIGKTALIPLPKPDKVAPGQKWAFVEKALGFASTSAEHARLSGSGVVRISTLIGSSEWFYLGTS